MRRGGIPCEGGGEDYFVREEGGLPCEGLGEDYLVREEGRTTL